MKGTLIILSVFLVFLLLFFPIKVNALSADDFGVNNFSAFTDFNKVLGFSFNVVIYIGWACVFIALAYILFSVIYKLMNTDNEEAVKEFRGAIQKLIIVVIFGLLLLSINFIVGFLARFFGTTVPPLIPYS